MYKIAVINDLSGFGKCSLTAAIPVISVMGVQPVPLPTAILSAQTGFDSYYIDDYTDRMDKITDEWKKMNFHPDGIYTGFLSDALQADKAIEFIETFGDKDTRILADPVMGDNGEAYPVYTETLREKMSLLVKKATVITPNLTEAIILLCDTNEARKRWEMLEKLDRKPYITEIEKIALDLEKKYSVDVVITGIDLKYDDKTEMGNLICQGDDISWVTAEKIGGSYSGTGDLFASILSAGIVRGMNLNELAEKAVEFLSKGIRDALREGTDRNEGICFERYLHELAK